MGTGTAHPNPPELPLPNQTRFSTGAASATLSLSVAIADPALTQPGRCPSSWTFSRGPQGKPSQWRGRVGLAYPTLRLSPLQRRILAVLPPRGNLDTLVTQD